jgi:glycerol uptake facilitator-like aquaporin
VLFDRRVRVVGRLRFAGADRGASGGTAPTPGSSDLQTFFMEVLIGFTLTACVLVAGPVSGGAANPARTLGPMIVSLKFFSVWAYVFGPVVGGVLGAVVYDKFIGPATAPDEEHAASANKG